MSENNGESDGGIDYSRLFVYAGPEQPSVSNMTIYDNMDGWVKDIPVQANIIGSSHYMSVAGHPYPYREITSCRPIEMVNDSFQPVVVNYDISRGIDDTLIRTSGPFRIEIDIITIPIEGNLDGWDLLYTFEGDGPSAPTAIDFNPNGWKTIHRYPEFNTDLFTRTTFFDIE